MEQNLEKKIEFKEKLLFFLKQNKLKISVTIFLILLVVVTSIILKIINEKRNINISEQFIQAGIYLDTDKVEESKKLYREIILSKNSFYSILALNILIEKELETDDVILNYFGKIENLDISKDQKDLIHLKKALFLIKNSKLNEANKLLNNLIESDSKLKNLAQDILTKK